jgi:hypothetical protein
MHANLVYRAPYRFTSSVVTPWSYKSWRSPSRTPASSHTILSFPPSLHLKKKEVRKEEKKEREKGK